MAQLDSTSPSLAQARLRGVLGLTLPLLLAGLLAWHSMGGLDIWLHHHAGQDILSGQGFPRANSYSFSEPDHPWTNHEWLFQVMVALTGASDSQTPLSRAVRGWNVVRLSLVAALMAVILLGDGGLGRWRQGRTPAWLGLCLLLGLAMLWPRLILRPELFSYLFLVLLVRALDRPLDRWLPTGGWLDLFHPARPLGLALVLTVLWSQMHGFSSLVLPLWVLAALSGWWRGKPLPERPGGLVLVSLPLLALGLCLTPNGLQGLLYPLRALGQFQGQEVELNRTISELTPLLKTRGSLGLTMAAFKASLAVGFLRVVVTWGRLSPLRVALWALAAAAAVAGQRNVGLYALTFMLLFTAPAGPNILGNRLQAAARSLPRILALAGPWLLVILTLALSGVWTVNLLDSRFYLSEGVSRRFGGGVTPARFPSETARQLNRQGPFRLFTNVDAAPFLLDRTQARLFIDGRTEAYSPRTWARYNNLKQADAAALADLAALAPDRVFLNTTGTAFRPLATALLSHPDWQLAGCEATGLLFTPPGTPAFGQPPCSPDWSALSAGPNPDKRDVRSADLLLAWSTNLALTGDTRGQERALRLALRLCPDHPQAQHNLGNILMAAGNLNEALTLFQGALGTNSRLAGSALNAGVCQMRLNRPAQAVTSFKTAVGLEPDNFQAWANLASAYLQTDQRDRARRAMARAVALRPGDARLREALRRMQ